LSRFLSSRGISSARAKGSEVMEYLIAGAISLALGVYLMYALLKPEKF
jgi:K+-transporting ATPase KdpF subunit